ncbi:MAG TPA: DUF1800 family protein, partial [Abditibacteriaceae bacterium]
MLALFAIIAADLVASNAAPAKSTSGESLQQENSPQQMAHVLNRLGFGPRPSDWAEVQRLGAQSWINTQLHPETIVDSAVEAKLASLKTLKLSTAQLMLAFHGDRALGKKRRIEKQLAQKTADGATPKKESLNER